MKNPGPIHGRHHIDKRAGAVADTIVGDDDEALDTNGAAHLIGCSTQFLEIGRAKGYGPKFVRLAPKMIRYRRGDIRAWLKERTYQRTSEYRKSDVA